MHFFIQYSIFIAQKTPVSGEIDVWRDAGEGTKWASAYVRALQQKRRRKETLRWFTSGTPSGESY